MLAGLALSSRIVFTLGSFRACAFGTKETETMLSLRERLRFHLFLVLASISVH